MTSSSGSAAMISLSVVRTEAESSTMSTRIFRSGRAWLDCMINLWLLEYGRSHLTHGDRRSDHRFRMTKNEITARSQMPDQPVDHRLLVPLVEIDQHIAEEDDVDIPVE